MAAVQGLATVRTDRHKFINSLICQRCQSQFSPLRGFVVTMIKVLALTQSSLATFRSNGSVARRVSHYASRSGQDKHPKPRGATKSFLMLIYVSHKVRLALFYGTGNCQLLLGLIKVITEFDINVFTTISQCASNHCSLCITGFKENVLLM